MAEENMMEEERTEAQEPRHVSRRRFLFGSGLAVGGAVVAGVAGSALTPARAEAGAGVAEAGVAAPSLNLTVGESMCAIQKAMGHVERNLQTCAGCRTCEAVCTLSHDGVVSPALARTWIVDYVVEGRRIEGITCKQCEGPECLYACPTGALHVEPTTGARVIDQEKCIGCKRCIAACPQAPNAPIRFNSLTSKSLKCDLCDGDPRCVKFCPEAAMSLVKES